MYYLSHFRDVTTLCQMLSYRSYNSSDVIFNPVKENEYSQLFSPPAKDFAVVQINVPAEEEYSLLKRSSASIIIVINGNGKTKAGSIFKSGSVFYLPSNEEFGIKTENNVRIYQAFCKVD